MVQGTNFPPISQGKGVKKNHVLSQSIVNELDKIVFNVIFVHYTIENGWQKKFFAIH